MTLPRATLSRSMLRAASRAIALRRPVWSLLRVAGRAEMAPMRVAAILARLLLVAAPVAVVEAAQLRWRAGQAVPRPAVMRPAVPAAAIVVVIHPAEVEDGLLHSQGDIRPERRHPHHRRRRHDHRRRVARLHINRLWGIHRRRRADAELNAHRRPLRMRQGACAQQAQRRQCAQGGGGSSVHGGAFMRKRTVARRLLRTRGLCKLAAGGAPRINHASPFAGLGWSPAAPACWLLFVGPKPERRRLHMLAQSCCCIVSGHPCRAEASCPSSATHEHDPHRPASAPGWVARKCGEWSTRTTWSNPSEIKSFRRV